MYLAIPCNILRKINYGHTFSNMGQARDAKNSAILCAFIFMQINLYSPITLREKCIRGTYLPELDRIQEGNKNFTSGNSKLKEFGSLLQIGNS